MWGLATGKLCMPSRSFRPSACPIRMFAVATVLIVFALSRALHLLHTPASDTLKAAP